MNIEQKANKTRVIKEFLYSPGKELTSEARKKRLPKISVITASFNQAEFIERTISSVFNQGYPNTEHIVIDGGSNDGTVDILKKYEKRIAYWVSEPDEGQTHAINKGLKHATGELIGFQNSDDVYLPGAFWKVAEVANKNPQAGMIYGDFLHLDDNDNVLDEQLLGIAKLWIQIMLGPQIHNQAAFWRKSVSDKIGLLDQRYTFDMDYEYFSRILAAGYKAVHIQDYLGAFRHHSANKTSNLGDISKKELKQVSDAYRKESALLRHIPRRLGRPLAMLMKAGKHLLDGRYDYLVRDRIKFK